MSMAPPPAPRAFSGQERVAQLQHALESRKSSLEAGKWEHWPKAHIPFSLVSQLNMVSNPRLKSASRLADAGCSAPALGRGVDAIFALGGRLIGSGVLTCECVK